MADSSTQKKEEGKTMNRMTGEEAKKWMERTMQAVCEVCRHRASGDYELLADVCSGCEARGRIGDLLDMVCGVSIEEKRELEERFRIFWEAYPRKEGKKEALAKWMKLAPDEELTGKIVRAVVRAKGTQQWKEGFIPHAKTYLHGERWNDEILDKPSKAAAHRNYEQRTVTDDQFAGLFLDLEGVIEA